MVLGPSVLSKGVGTGPTTTHFDLACAQTMPRLLGFDHRLIADRVATGKLWQANIIKITRKIVDKMNKRGDKRHPIGQK